MNFESLRETIKASIDTLITGSSNVVPINRRRVLRLPLEFKPESEEDTNSGERISNNVILIPNSRYELELKAYGMRNARMRLLALWKTPVSGYVENTIEYVYFFKEGEIARVFSLSEQNVPLLRKHCTQGDMLRYSRVALLADHRRVLRWLGCLIRPG